MTIADAAAVREAGAAAVGAPTHCTFVPGRDLRLSPPSPLVQDCRRAHDASMADWRVARNGERGARPMTGVSADSQGEDEAGRQHVAVRHLQLRG